LTMLLFFSVQVTVGSDKLGILSMARAWSNLGQTRPEPTRKGHFSGLHSEDSLATLHANKTKK